MGIKKHFEDVKIDVYRPNKLSNFIGYTNQYQKTKVIGISKYDIIRVLSGYDLGDSHHEIMKKLSNFYNLSVELLDQMYQENISMEERI